MDETGQHEVSSVDETGQHGVSSVDETGGNVTGVTPGRSITVLRRATPHTTPPGGCTRQMIRFTSGALVCPYVRLGAASFTPLRVAQGAVDTNVNSGGV